jgi:excisionase family DNA binding protein
MAHENETTGAITPAMQEMKPAEGFIKKDEVAKRLGKTVRCIDNWMARGLIPFFKIGRSVMFKWSDVESHLAQTCRVCRRNS